MPASKRKTNRAEEPASSATMKENFEKDLQNLAEKAQKDASRSSIGDQIRVYIKVGLVLTLAAAYANASYLALSPVYGSIPSSIYHSRLVMGAAFVGWASNIYLNRLLPFNPSYLLPIIAMWIPTIQWFMYRFSSQLTAHWGPLVTELLTIFPLITITTATVATTLENADFSFLPQQAAEAVPGIGSWLFYKLAESFTGGFIQTLIGESFLTTRVGVQLFISAHYLLVAPSAWIGLTLPSLYHVATMNTHAMIPQATQGLNFTLQADNWLLLDRKESKTGYISVLESLDQGFRVMRCDHSLLGGEWVKVRPTDPRLAEPIYGVFVMLEAVRLVEVPEPVADDQAKALVVGLGIGTTPAALVSHGIDTTVVEIDPVVHEFASKYFHLPSNHTAVIDDAVTYTESLVHKRKARFDYIVHDVFTGGAEPIPLFTLEFLQGLNALLKPNGVIAINYAGDFTHPAPRIVVNTIREVFPSCRIFRESETPSKKKLAEEGMDFTNMVIFCRKTSDKVTFRKPVEADLLGSRARRAFLLPQHEVLDKHFTIGENDGILTKNDTQKLAQWHQKSALGHWEVMRTVIPAKVWEQW